LAALARFEGVEFVLGLRPGQEKPESWGGEDAERLAAWVRETLQRFTAVGEALRTGPPIRVEALTRQTHVIALPSGDTTLCAGFRRGADAAAIRERAEQMQTLWLS
jgi:hypothetical protein